jgi:hypothetical protein
VEAADAAAVQHWAEHLAREADRCLNAA